jgi:hypothetical protein
MPQTSRAVALYEVESESESEGSRLRAENTALRERLDALVARVAGDAKRGAEQKAMTDDLLHHYDQLLERYTELGREAARMHEAYKRVLRSR